MAVNSVYLGVCRRVNWGRRRSLDGTGPWEHSRFTHSGSRAPEAARPGR